MDILITTQEGPLRDIYFPEEVLERLRPLGNLRFNDTGSPFTPGELAEGLKGAQVCITHWGCPSFTPEVLAHAEKLKLIAHAAGSVGSLVNAQVYEKGIKVSSANPIMAHFVAEGVLAYFLAGLRLIPQFDSAMRKGLWIDHTTDDRTLFGCRLGLVGLGTVGRYLLDLLKPFDVKIKLYDPYLKPGSLSQYPFVELDSLENVLAFGDIVSVHASLTPETYRLVDGAKLDLIREGALFVNTSRGRVIDEAALAERLKARRLSAVLDVYEQEPLESDSPLRELDNVILMPHRAAGPSRHQMTHAMVDEIERLASGQPLAYEIGYEQFQRMTQNDLKMDAIKKRS